MGGYLSGVLAVYAINLLLAYAVYLPASAGMLNLGAAGLMAVGAYAAAYLDARLGAPLWISLAAATVLGAVLAYAIAFPILRTRGVYLVLATFAFGEVVAGVLVNVDAVGGAAGMAVPTYVGLPLIAALAAVGTLAMVWLMSTRFGLALRSIHDDETATELFGIDVRRCKVLAFGIGGAYAGLAGALYAQHFNYVDVSTFNLALSLDTLLFVLIGGTQTVWGPLAGAAIFSFLPELLRGSVQWRYVVFAILIIAVMALRPSGLVTRRALLALARGRTP